MRWYKVRARLALDVYARDEVQAKQQARLHLLSDNQNISDMDDVVVDSAEPTEHKGRREDA